MNLPRVELLLILSGVLLVYAAESWLSCLRLSAFVKKSRWFYFWDSALTVLALLAMVGLLRDSSDEWRVMVILVAVIGTNLGTITSRTLKKS